MQEMLFEHRFLDTVILGAGVVVLGAVGVCLKWWMARRRDALEKRSNASCADQMAAVLDNLPDLAWGKDLDGRFTVANRALADACGVSSPSEMIGKTDRDFFPASQADAFMKDDREIVLSGAGKMTEEPLTTKEGASRWLLTFKTPIFDPSGAVVGTVGLARDVTDRKEMETRLRLREREIRTMVENSPDVIIRYATDGRRLYANPAMRELLGVSLSDLIGKSPAETGLAGQGIGHGRHKYVSFRPLSSKGGERVADETRGDVSRQYNEFIRRVAATEKSSIAELAWVGEDNKKTTFLMRFVPERNEQGYVVAVLAVGRDITERKEMEEQLRSTHAQLENLLVNLPGVSFLKRHDAEDSLVIFTSDGDRGKFPFSLEDVNNIASAERLPKMWHPDDHEKLRELNRRMAAGESRCEVRARLKRGENTWCWVEIREKFIEKRDGAVLSGGLVIDIDAYVKAEESLMQKEREHRRLVEVLAEERRLSAFGDLAGRIAHDFNNLIGAIEGNAQFILEDAGGDNPAVVQHAKRILGSSRNGKALVDQVLILTGRKRLSRSRFRIVDLFDEVKEDLAAMGAMRLHMVGDGMGAEQEIEADRAQLTLALRHLCRNALETSGDGEAIVAAIPVLRESDVEKCFAERSITNSNWAIDAWDDEGEAWGITGHWLSVEAVALVVTDESGGMDAEMIRNAFVPFYTTWDQAAHPGLGLSIVQGVALAHGGAVVVRSAMGRGTSVEIRLPVRKAVSPTRSWLGGAAQDRSGRSNQRRIPGRRFLREARTI